MRTYKRTIGASPVENYRVSVTFEDGTRGVFDFKPYLSYACYSPLKDQGFFSLVKADHGTLSWPGDIDIAPEAVWEDAVRGHSCTCKGI